MIGYNGKIRKVRITSDCSQCGICLVAERNLFEETEDGKIVVKNNGTVLEKDFSGLENAMNLCYDKAIIVFEEIDNQSVEENNKRVLLKAIDNLDALKPIKICNKDYFFEMEDLEPQININVYASEFKYRTYEQAEEAGLEHFKSMIYSQQTIYARSVLFDYTNRYLSKYYDFLSNDENYLNLNKKMVEDVLEEISIWIENFAKKEIHIPSDFKTFNIHNEFLRDYIIENMKSIKDRNYFFHFEPLSYYDTYIDVDYNEINDKYRYVLNNEIVESFKSNLTLSMFDKVMQDVKDVMSIYQEAYNTLFQKEINKKMQVLQPLYKRMQNTNVDVIDLIKQALEESFELSNDKIYRTARFDSDYNSDFRFRSYNSVLDAAYNRKDRMNDDMKYAIEKQLPKDLAEIYADRIEDIIKEIIKITKSVFVKNGKNIPDKIIRVKEIDFESSNCNGLIDDWFSVSLQYPDSKRSAIVYMLKKYFEKIASKHCPFSFPIKVEINESIDFVQGLFKEKEIEVYGYMLRWDYDAFSKMNSLICNEIHEKNILQKFKNNIVNAICIALKDE